MEVFSNIGDLGELRRIGRYFDIDAGFGFFYFPQNATIKNERFKFT